MQIIERYRRRESSVEESLIEMYLAGISVRRVEERTSPKPCGGFIRQARSAGSRRRSNASCDAALPSTGDRSSQGRAPHGRNHLAHRTGDAINAVIAAAVLPSPAQMLSVQIPGGSKNCGRPFNGPEIENFTDD